MTFAGNRVVHRAVMHSLEGPPPNPTSSIAWFVTRTGAAAYRRIVILTKDT